MQDAGVGDAGVGDAGVEGAGVEGLSTDRSSLRGWTLLLVGLWAVVTLPWVLGLETLILRDVFATHVPYKAFGAQELAEGRVPAVNPTWALGQPFRGNPNALPYYPGNVAYRVLPFWSAFQLHYAVHWLLAGFAMWVLARILGQTRQGAFLAGLAYGAGGYVISALSFYNILAVVAWAPLAAAGAAARGRLALCAGGLAWSLALLGGEPVTALLTSVLIFAAAALHHGAMAGAARALGVGLLGLALSAPQWVAFARVLPFSTRGAVGVGGLEASGYSLELPRLFELLVPFPLGIPARFDAWGFWAGNISPTPPYVMTFFAGALAIPLAWIAWRRQRVWALLAVAGVVLALAGGWNVGELMSRASFGLFRYSEKLLVWTAWSLALLVGWGASELGRDRRTWPRWASRIATLAGVLGGLVLGLAAIQPRAVTGWVERQLSPGFPAGTPRALLLLWGLSLLLLALVWYLAARDLRHGRGNALVGPYVLSVLPLLAFVHTDSTEIYRQPSPIAGALDGRSAIWNPSLAVLTYGFRPMPYHLLPDAVARNRFLALDLDPAPGVLHGLSYPTAKDLEGLASPLSNLVLRRVRDLSPLGHYRWMRVLGVEAMLVPSVPVRPLPILGRAPRPGGLELVLYGVENPAPRAWWPSGFDTAPDVDTAFERVASSADAVARPVLVTPGAELGIEQGAAAEIQILKWTPDRIEVKVEGGGGVLALRRAFLPLYTARLAEAEALESGAVATSTPASRRLKTLPINVCLLGVEVPAGRHRVVIEISDRPEKVAAFGSFALLCVLAWIAYRDLRRPREKLPSSPG